MIETLIIEHSLEIVMVAIQCGVLKYAWNKFRKYADKSEARDDAVRSLLRADIISMCHKSMTKGYIVLYNRENLIDMHTAYEALGGNGAVKSIYEQTMNLPTVLKDEDFSKHQK